MLRNLLLKKPKDTMNTQGKYAIWTGNGGYFSGSFGAGPAFRSDPMFATKFDSKWEAEQKAKKLGFDSPSDYEIRQVE